MGLKHLGMPFQLAFWSSSKLTGLAAKIVLNFSILFKSSLALLYVWFVFDSVFSEDIVVFMVVALFNDDVVEVVTVTSACKLPLLVVLPGFDSIFEL